VPPLRRTGEAAVLTGQDRLITNLPPDAPRRNTMTSDVMTTLLNGLDETDRIRTLTMINEQNDADITAAAHGTCRRNVDVGTRTRTNRPRTSTSPDDTVDTSSP
jgi:hypothetical protein